jgi:uracil phosphoribosyltransferase
MTRLLVEEALNVLPVTEKSITTLTDSVYNGVDLHQKVVGVSIMRSGDSMTEPLQEVVKEIACGKILIQFDEHRVPRLFFYRLPEDVNQSYVILLDPMIATGSTLIMALRLLLDHGVPEDHIIFITLIAAKVGLSNVCYAYPKIKIIAGAIDERIDRDGKIHPGLGHFGDRYFGTEVDVNEFDSMSQTSADSTGMSPKIARDDNNSSDLKSPKNVNLFKSSQF